MKLLDPTEQNSKDSWPLRIVIYCSFGSSDLFESPHCWSSSETKHRTAVLFTVTFSL